MCQRFPRQLFFSRASDSHHASLSEKQEASRESHMLGREKHQPAFFSRTLDVQGNH